MEASDSASDNSQPIPIGWLRVGTLSIGGLSLMACVVGIRFGLQIGSRSPLLWGGVGTAGLMGALWLALALSPLHLLQRIGAGIGSMAARLRASANHGRGAGRGAGWLIALSLIAYVLCCAAELRHPDEPWDDDQGAFLIEAASIRDSGGLTQLLAALFRGEYEEANRHPLYLAALALHPSVAYGRSLSLLFGLATLLVSTWLLGRWAGWRTAGLFSVLLATNGAFVGLSTRVVCETLLMLLSALAWFAARKWRDSVRSDGGSTPRPTLRLVALGAWLGLVWLTKGTGLLLFGGTLAWLWIVTPGSLRSHAGLRERMVTTLLVGGAFVVVASPLLVRNARRFGQPFYNVNSQLLFVDAYEDPMALAERRSTGEAAREYLRTRTFGQLVWRELHGLVWEGYILVRGLGPWPLDDARVLFGLPLLLLAIIGAVAEPAYPWRLTLIWTGLSWVIFAWYVPIAAGERFLVPLIVPLFAAASSGGVAVVQAMRGR